MTTTYRGFSTTMTQGSDTSLFDLDIIKADLLNQFNIRLGEVPGRSGFGSVLMELMSEPFDNITESLIRSEVDRVLRCDPRISVNDINVSLGSDGHSVTITADCETVELDKSLVLYINATDNGVQISS